MDLLAAYRTFQRVADTGSFSAVAREAGTTQPAISRQIAALEEYLGTRLIQRTTRRLALTEDGRDLVPHAQRVLDAAEETEAAIGRRRISPAGLVRMGCPSTIGRLYVAPRIRRLLDRYPELSVELHMSDQTTDMIAAGLDMAIRGGTVEDSSLVSRRIGSARRVVAAAPEYIAEHGRPERPEDLAQHSCLVFVSGALGGDEWQFQGRDGPVTVRVSGRFRADNIDALREAAINGLGFARLAAWQYRDDVAAKRLVPVLKDWQPPPVPIHAVYPSRRNLAARTRAVIDFFVEEFRLDPNISAYGQV